MSAKSKAQAPLRIELLHGSFEAIDGFLLVFARGDQLSPEKRLPFNGCAKLAAGFSNVVYRTRREDR
jgi:hypothetical protein